MNELANRLAGGLTGALLGDAMGSVTEMLTSTQIVQRYGRVQALLAPATGTFASGRQPGQLTDDGLMTLALAEGLLAKPDFTAADAAQVLLRWADDPEAFARFAGPSSRKAVLALREGASPQVAGTPDLMSNDLRISNGAAMKVAPAGWVNPGQPNRAVELAGAICVPTHNSHIAFAGAGAVAAAVAVAVVSADLAEVLEAAVQGAQFGHELGLREAVEVPAPSMAARIELALDLVHRSTNPVARLDEVIGSGLPITEAVPMALGMVATLGDDPFMMIETLVNLGSDSDTVASIAGAIAGSRTGIDAFPPALIEQIETVNGIDIKALAARLARIGETEA